MSVEGLDAKRKSNIDGLLLPSVPVVDIPPFHSTACNCPPRSGARLLPKLGTYFTSSSAEFVEWSLPRASIWPTPVSIEIAMALSDFNTSS